jgi:replication factor A2
MSYNPGGYDSAMGGGYGSSTVTSNYESKSNGNRSGTSNRRNVDEQALIPVTAKMVLASTDSISGGGGVLADGREPYLVKIVGAVKEVIKSSTNYMYSLEDGTGTVQVKEFIDDSSYNDAAQQQRELAAQDHIYIRVIGKLTSYEGNKQIVANNVRRVTGGGNEMTHHLLEVVHSGEKHKKGETMVGRPDMNPSAMMYSNSASSSYGQQNSMTSARNAPGGGRNDMLRHELIQFIRSAGGKTYFMIVIYQFR